jgi:hypothetical protein
MSCGRRDKPMEPQQLRALARRPDDPNASVESYAADVDANPAESVRLARLYLSPLARLFNLTSELDEIVRGLVFLDSFGWKNKVRSILRTLADEKLRLQAIEPATRLRLRCRGGQRGIVTDAAAEHRAEAAKAYDPEAGVRDQGRRILQTMRECMDIYNTDFSEVGLSDDQKSISRNHIAGKSNTRQSHRSGAGRGSQAIAVYVEPIQGLRRAFDHADFIEIARQLGRVSAQVIERIERRSAELDRIILSDGPVEAPQQRELNRRYLDLTLESKRIALIDRAVGGIFRCFGGQERLAMELAFRDSVKSEVPTDPRDEAILDRLCKNTCTAPSPSPLDSANDGGQA